MTPPEILKALSQGHERWPGDALEAASSQRSKVSLLLLEKLAQTVAEIERIEAAFPSASLFDGDTQFIFDIILDVGADPSVRFWQWHALTLIGLEGNLDRTVAADFARQAFGRLSTGEGESLIWAGWEKLISRLALTELAPLVRKAHDADLLVESTYEALAGVRELEPWVEDSLFRRNMVS